jgi:hypothetical protein
MTIDPFRQRQVSDVAGRFMRERKRHQRQADLMWVGTLVAMFSDHELRLLDDLGYLSQHDSDLLSQAERGIITTAQARESLPTRGEKRR